MYFEDIKKEIEAQIGEYEKLLGSNGAEDYSSYRQYVGTISGLKWCRDLVAQIQKRVAEGEDD